VTTTETYDEARRQWDRAFGALLRRTREARGLSQEEVARQVGVRAETIAKYEQGRSPNPTLMRLIALSQALGVAPHELVPVEPFPLEAYKEQQRAARARRARGPR
jgi:transcriptional regulator with XRE-family HTH domain